MTTLAPMQTEIAHLLEAWPEARLKSLLDEVLLVWHAEDLRAVIKVRWNSRLRTTIGRADLSNMILELNPALLARYPEQVRHVFIHEAAHLVARRLFGARIAPHGKQWKKLMTLASESTRATHTLDVGELANKRAPRRWRAKRRWKWW